jgi:hypothetical protein
MTRGVCKYIYEDIIALLESTYSFTHSHSLQLFERGNETHEVTTSKITSTVLPQVHNSPIITQNPSSQAAGPSGHQK